MSKRKVNYLVCVNKEKYSEVALRFACHVAKRSDGNIILLHVTEPTDYKTLGIIADKMEEENRQSAEELAQKLAQDAKRWTGNMPVIMLREGLIEDEIVSVIKEDPTIHILVVGSAADGGPKSKVLPPLVSKVGSKLMVPVLIVPGNLSGKDIERLSD
jgi:nucleotide-binding universal stress UspA family protein